MKYGRKVARIKHAMLNAPAGTIPAIAIELSKCSCLATRTYADLSPEPQTVSGLRFGPVALASMRFDDKYMYITSRSLGNEPHMADGTPAAFKIELRAIYGTYLCGGGWTNMFYDPETV